MEAAKVESFLIVAEHHSKCSLALAVARTVAFCTQRGSCFLGLMFGVHLAVSKQDNPNQYPTMLQRNHRNVEPNQ